MDRAQAALTTVVLAHFGVAIVHGAAHVNAAVPLGMAAMTFVMVVIQAGPLAGLLLSRWRPIAGALVVATTMAASLIFGLINHFLVQGADHVGHVAGGWLGLFGATAVLLAVTEAAGVTAGLWCGSRTWRSASV